MNNSDMKPNRYLNWHNARKRHRQIISHLARGGRVLVGTYTKATVYRHPGQFRCDHTGLYAVRGKQWDCLDFTPFTLI
jgi:hypothetical protein